MSAESDAAKLRHLATYAAALENVASALWEDRANAVDVGPMVEEIARALRSILEGDDADLRPR